MASRSKVSSGYLTPQAARQQKALEKNITKKTKDDIGILPMNEFDEDKFKKLLACPIKRKLVLELITSEKDNIEKFKQKLSKTNTPERSGSPLKNAHKKQTCDSPTMLFRKRALEQLNENSSRPSSRSSSRQSDVSSPIRSTTANFDRLLDGVIAFVEFGNDEKNRSNAVRVLMQSMGATIRDTFTRDVTHVVFKDGSFKTFQKAKLLKVHLVSVLWIEAVRTTGTRVLERNYPALGSNAYDYNVSAVCSQMQKEYEDIIRDELYKSITTGTPMPSKKSLIDRRRTMSSMNFMRSQDVISSQDKEVADIMSRRQTMAISNVAASSPEFSDDGSDVGPMIDGDIISKSKTRDTDVIEFSDMDLTALNSGKENNPNTSNSYYNLKTPKINTTNIETTPGLTPDQSLYKRRTRLFENVDVEKSTSLKIFSRNECVASPNVEIIDKNSIETLHPYPVKLCTDKDVGENSSTMSALKLSSDAIKNVEKSTSTNMSSLQISTSSKDKMDNLSVSKSKLTDHSLPEIPDSSEIDYITKRRKPTIGRRNEDDKQMLFSIKQNRRKTIHNNQPTGIDNPIANEKKSRRKTINTSKNTDNESDVENALNNVKANTVGTDGSKKSCKQKTVHASNSTDTEDGINNKKMENIDNNTNEVYAKKSRRKTIHVSKHTDNEAGVEDALDNVKSKTVGSDIKKKFKQKKVNVGRIANTEGGIDKTLGNIENNTNANEVSEKNSSRKSVNVISNPNSADTTDKSSDYITDSISDDTKKKARRKTVHYGKIIDNKNRIQKSSDDIESNASVNVEINRKSRRKTIQVISSAIDKEIVDKSFDNTVCNTKSIDNIKGKSRQKAVNIKDSVDNEDRIENPLDTAKLDMNGMDTVMRKNRRKTMYTSKNTENDSTESSNMKDSVNEIRRSRRRHSLPESKDDPFHSNNASLDKTKTNSSSNESACAGEGQRSKPQRSVRKLYDPQTPVSCSFYDDEKEREIRRKAKEKRKSKSDDENFIIPAIAAHMLNSITLTKKAKNYLDENQVNFHEILNVDTDESDSASKVKSKPKGIKRHKGNIPIDFDDEQKELREEMLNKRNCLESENIPSPKKKCKGNTSSTCTDSSSSGVKAKSHKNPINIVKHRRKSVRITQKKKLNDSSSSSDGPYLTPITPVYKRRSTLEFQSLAQMSAKRKLKLDKLKHPSIVCTKLHKDDTFAFSQIVKKLGGFVVEDEVTNKTTHLVAGEPKRTINMLKAMALGCWILKHEWILKSLEAGKWLPEEDYEETDFSPAVQKSRLQREAFGPSYSMDVFQDCGIIYVARGSLPRCSDLRELITLCKGRVTSIIRNATVIVGGYSKTEGTTCVHEAWLLDSIQNYRKMPFKKYIISTDNKVPL